MTKKTKKPAALQTLGLGELKPDPRQIRRHTERNLAMIGAGLQAVGAARSIVVDETNTILAGNGTIEAARASGFTKVRIVEADGSEIIAVRRRGLSEKAKVELALYDNRSADFAEYDPAALARVTELVGVDAAAFFTAAEHGALSALPHGESATAASLVERFGVPPFSVLDARQGYWQARKAAWMAFGIESDLGRGEAAPERTNLNLHQTHPATTATIDFYAQKRKLEAEIGRKLTTPAATKILRERGTITDDRAAARVAKAAAREAPELTPIETHEGYRVKRDDRFAIAGVSGGKARTCWSLAQGAVGLVTAGSRSSPQANIVAHVAAALGVPCRVHTPTGALSAELLAARAAGAEIVQHKAGYNAVIVARARADAKARGWREIPFGMECAEAIAQTRRQVANLPADVGRLVIPVGSGMSLAGVLHGLRDAGRVLAVLGVVVGADPRRRLDKYAPKGWRATVTLAAAGDDYARPAKTVLLGALRLDSHYEAKCLGVLAAGDLLWCVGLRETEHGDV